MLSNISYGLKSTVVSESGDKHVLDRLGLSSPVTKGTAANNNRRMRAVWGALGKGFI